MDNLLAAIALQAAYQHRLAHAADVVLPATMQHGQADTHPIVIAMLWEDVQND